MCQTDRAPNFCLQLYRFLARRTDSKFNRIILRRLFMSRIYRPPMSLSRLARHMSKGEDRKGRIAVVVGTITQDNRIFKIPKGLTVSWHQSRDSQVSNAAYTLLQRNVVAP